MLRTSPFFIVLCFRISPPASFHGRLRIVELHLPNMKRISAVIVVLVCISIVSAMPVSAQSRRPSSPTDGKSNQRQASTPTPVPTPVPQVSAPVDDGEVIKVSTQLVSVPVRVMDKKGRFIGGLGKENFKVLEDGVEQEVALFSNEHEPFTVALVLDMSYSTTFKITEIQSAAIAFIEQLRPQDKVMVVSFDAEVHILCEATGDRKEIYRAIKSTKISTGTSLYEAVDMVINSRFREIDGRKAMILFTDGVDTTSRRSNDSYNLNDALELDAIIYPVRYDTFADVQRMSNGTTVPKPPPISIPTATPDPFPISIPKIAGTMAGSQGTTQAEYQKAEEFLDGLAQNTGGRVYPATTLGNLNEAYAKIASELREFYSIAYYPNADRVAGKRTNVKVRVDREGLVVRSREGFIRRKTAK
jgi:Ca-activated chloride channel family protein